MPAMIPSHLLQEAQSLEAEIRKAFGDISREGGISWSEARVRDTPGSSAEDAQHARDSDADKNWNELVNSQHKFAMGVGGFPYLDAIGYRYYLPAAMIRILHDGEVANEGIDQMLTLHKVSKKPAGNSLRQSALNQWSLLDDRQRRAVAHFLRFMADWSKSIQNWVEMEHWQRAYDSYWIDFA
jgi:hypothetical protein